MQRTGWGWWVAIVTVLAAPGSHLSGTDHDFAGRAAIVVAREARLGARPPATALVPGSGEFAGTAPEIRWTPGQFDIPLLAGQTAERVLEVGNTGGGDLSFRIELQAASSPGPAFPLPDDAFLFSENFEDGNLDGWIEAPSRSLKEVTYQTAADGSLASHRQEARQTTHFSGIHRLFDAERPRYVGFWIRSSSRTTNDSYVAVRDDRGCVSVGGCEVIWFYAGGNGRFYCNENVGGNGAVPYDAETWYHVEFKNVDFARKRFDYWVDERLVQRDVPMRHRAVIEDVARVDLYSFDEGAEAWWDEIMLADRAPPRAFRVGPRRGTVAPGATESLTLGFDAHRLPAGRHEAWIVISSNDPVAPRIEVPVTLRILGAPDVELLDGMLELGAQFVGVEVEAALRVANDGTDPLSLDRVDFDHPDFSADVSGVVIPPGDQHTVMVRYRATTVGPAAAELTLHSNDPDEPQVTAVVQAEGRPAPVIDVTPETLAESLFTGGRATTPLTVANRGGSALELRARVEQEQGLLRVRARPVGPRRQASVPLRDAMPTFRFDAARWDEISAVSGLPSGPIGVEPQAATIPPGESVDLALSFDAAGLAGGRYGAVLVLESNDPARPEARVRATLDVTDAPHVETSPQAIDFGQVFVGATAERLVRIANGGTRTLELGEISSIGNDFSVVPAAPFVLAPGSSRELTVRFHPGTLGLAVGNLRILSNDPDRASAELPLTGRGTAGPELSLEPDRLTASLATGQVALRTLTVHNRGNGSASWSIELRGLAAGSSWLTVTPRAGTLAAGQALPLSVELNARARVGGRYTAEIVLRSDDPVRPEIGVPVDLEIMDAADVEISTTAIDFGVVFLGQSAESDMTVTNRGVLPLVLTDVRATGQDYAIDAGSPEIDPGESSVFRVRFTPSQAGARTARLVLETNDPDAPEVSVALAGRGAIAPRIEITPAALGERLFAGESRVRNLSIANAVPDGADLIYEISVESPQSFVTVQPDRGVLAGGSTAGIEVRFAAEELNAGDYVAELVVRSNDPDNPRVVVPTTLRVDGQPVLCVAETALDFGDVYVGTSASSSLTVTNSGSDHLVVSLRFDPSDSFEASPGNFALPPGSSVPLSVAFRPTVPGPVDGTLVLVSNDPERPEVPVQLTGRGRVPPRVTVDPPALLERLHVGERSTRSLTVGNPGGESLAFTADLRYRDGGGLDDTVVLFEDDFEHDRPGWLTEAYWESPDLWHRSGIDASSGSAALWCGVAGGDDYDTSTRVSNAVLTPPIDLRRVHRAVTLAFFEKHVTEEIWDQCLVDVSVDGGSTWTPLRGDYGVGPSGDSGGWVGRQLDLQPFAGSIVRVRFYFETLDDANNDRRGWWIDDVQVRAVVTPWVAVEPARGEVHVEQHQQLELTFDTTDRRRATFLRTILDVDSNDPLRPQVEIPVELEVSLPARLAFPGPTVTVNSEQAVIEGRSLHRLTLPAPPAGDGEVRLRLDGDYAAARAHATATAEGYVIGRLGGTGATCSEAAGSWMLEAPTLDALAAEDLLEIEVRDSPAVGTGCAVHRHGVRLTYPRVRDRVDFGNVLPSSTYQQRIDVANVGESELAIHEISAPSGVSVEPGTFRLDPRATGSLTVRWSPDGPASLAGRELTFATNDPLRPIARLALTGTATPAAPDALIEPTSVIAVLPPRSERIVVEQVMLSNLGGTPLDWTASVAGHLVRLETPQGTLPPGASTGLRLFIGGPALDPGDYEATLLLESNDPQRPRIEVGITLRVREVELEGFRLSLEAPHADRSGTVEARLQLPADHAPQAIVLSSVTLEGVPADAAPVLYEDTDRDGVAELIVQFDVEALRAVVPASGVRPLRIAGEVLDTAWFTGTAYLRGVIIIDP